MGGGKCGSLSRFAGNSRDRKRYTGLTPRAVGPAQGRWRSSDHQGMVVKDSRALEASCLELPEYPIQAVLAGLMALVSAEAAPSSFIQDLLNPLVPRLAPRPDQLVHVVCGLYRRRVRHLVPFTEPLSPQ